MNCNEAAPLLPTYGDGELDPMQSAEVEKHLLACAECAARGMACAAVSQPLDKVGAAIPCRVLRGGRLKSAGLEIERFPERYQRPPT